MKKLVVLTLTLLFVSGCETLPVQSNHASGQTRYVCYTYDYPAEHVLTLPVPPNNADTGLVDVWFQGNILPALYERQGLTQLWSFEVLLYVKVDADNDAQYWDFRGAEEGEKRTPEAVFECNRRDR